MSERDKPSDASTGNPYVDQLSTMTRTFTQIVERNQALMGSFLESSATAASGAHADEEGRQRGGDAHRREHHEHRVAHDERDGDCAERRHACTDQPRRCRATRIGGSGRRRDRCRRPDRLVDRRTPNDASPRIGRVLGNRTAPALGDRRVRRRTVERSAKGAVSTDRQDGGADRDPSVDEVRRRSAVHTVTGHHVDQRSSGDANRDGAGELVEGQATRLRYAHQEVVTFDRLIVDPDSSLG